MSESPCPPDAKLVALAYPLTELGRILVRRRALDEAQPLLRRALALREKAGGAEAALLAEPLLGLAESHLARGQPDEAAPLLERARTLRDPDVRFEVDLTLAEALWQLGNDRRRARALAEGARAGYEHLHHRPGLELVNRWLADHPG